MSLWNATLAEQTGITTTLLDPDGLRPKLLGTPLLAAMVPGLDHVHAQLVVARPAEPPPANGTTKSIPPARRAATSAVASARIPLAAGQSVTAQRPR